MDKQKQNTEKPQQNSYGYYLFRALKEQKNLIGKKSIILHTLFEGSRSSTSKLDVSLGLVTTGIYGAVAREENYH